VTVDVVMVMMVAVGMSFGGKPLPDVWNFLIRIIKPAAEKAIRHGLALGCIEDRRRGIECPQASRNPLALHGVNEIAFCQHNSVGDGSRAYRQAFGQGSQGDGWYSFDTHGVHFIALVNTLSLEKLGHLGADQIDFVRRDVAGLSSDTPIVLFSHIPLFAMYPQWGWSTDDALQVLSLVKRFASVTALNGHVHQLFTRVEGNVTFHSATTTAYPLPKPGGAPAPTPQVLPARQLQAALGIRTVAYNTSPSGLAVTDRRLT